MINLHSHTFFSDGDLLPEEMAIRCEEMGYEVIGITDHVGPSNMEEIIPKLIRAADDVNRTCKIKIIPGVEFTHTPPRLLKTLVTEARKLGARIIIVHGETIVEPVPRGTNKTALNCDIDILAHPGLITEEEVKLARKNNIYLEITSRQGHSLTNGHVAGLARKIGAELVLNSDAHFSDDLITKDMAVKIAIGAGLDTKAIDRMFKNSEILADKILKRC